MPGAPLRGLLDPSRENWSVSLFLQMAFHDIIHQDVLDNFKCRSFKFL